MAQVSTPSLSPTLARPPPASFATLPDELLDAIIDRLPSSYVVPALNRRLVPFNRAQRFKVLDICMSDPSYYRLNRCLRLNPALGTLVQELRVEMPMAGLRAPPPPKQTGKKGTRKGKAQTGGGNVEQEEAFGKLGTKEEELNYLLAASPNLQHLEVYGSVGFIDTLAPGIDFFTRIPTLNRLVLDSRQWRHYTAYDLDEEEEEVYFDPFDLSGLREIDGDPLSSCSHLNSTEYLIDLRRHSSSLDSQAPQNHSFDLRLFACNNRKQPFLTLLSTLSLSTLQIVHFGSKSDLIKLLRAVPRPESLIGLSLFALDNYQHLENLLASFTNVSSLSRGQHASSGTDLFYSVLSSLPLQHLHLGPGAEIDCDRIHDLVADGPRRISTLSTLTLDNIDAKMPPLRREYDRDCKSRRYDEWVLPRWEDDFSRAGAEALKFAAVGAGVEVKGTTFYALEIMETEECKKDKAEEDARRAAQNEEDERRNRQWLAEQEEKEQQRGWHDEVCSCDRNPERCNKYRDNMGLKPYEGNYRWNRRW